MIPCAPEHLARIQAVPFGGCDDKTWIAGCLAVYVEMIENRVHFAQAAYRDAEFPWILGDLTVGHPNGEVWEPALGEQLADTLLEPVGQWCLYFSGKNEPRRPAADAWLAEHRPPVQWIPDRPLARANEQGMLAPFVAAIRKRRVCVVGPRHMRGLKGVFTSQWCHLPVPDGTAWKEAATLGRKIQVLAETAGFDLFLIAAGSGAALTIHRAWPEVKERATLIDIGATLDPYAGVFSRNLYRTSEWRKHVMPKNLPNG
jgi:hypothetical protein